MIILRIIVLLTLLSNLACSQALVWEKNDKKVALEKIVDLDKTVFETSGLINFADTYWTINDSGDASYIYQINPSSGKVIKRIDLKGAKNKDWESLATDDTHVYIGDTGNNRSDRSLLTIYRVSKSALLEAKKEVKKFETIRYSYPEDRQKYDCEAMILLDQKIWLFTKNRDHLDTHVYTLPNRTGKYTATYYGKFQTDGLITSADLYNDNLILLGYTDGPNYLPFVWTFKNFSKQKTNKLKGKGTLITPVLQFEAIITKGKNEYWLTCEGGKKGKKPGIWALDLN